MNWFLYTKDNRNPVASFVHAQDLVVLLAVYPLATVRTPGGRLVWGHTDTSRDPGEIVDIIHRRAGWDADTVAEMAAMLDRVPGMTVEVRCGVPT